MSLLDTDQIRIPPLDIFIITAYILGIVVLGVYLGWRQRRGGRLDAERYFLAGKSLSWVSIGLALFSTNISTVHLVSLAEQGYVNGLLYGNFETMAAFTLIALALFFAPFYIRSRVATLPDFLEKRYNRPCRDYLTILSILSAVFIHIGFTIYAGAIVLRGLFGIGIWQSTIAIAVLTGLYTVVGGLLAVVVTGAVQTVILLAGAVCLTVAGFWMVGGWGGLTASVDPVALTLLRDGDQLGGLPWYVVLLGYPVIGLWYWCADQTIVQRVLGAKDENHARVGALFAGFIKILPVFVLVLPGLIYLGLVQQGRFPAPVSVEAVYADMIANLLPVGLTGVVAAALLAALMSTVAGALNSIATLFSYDVVKRYRPRTGDRQLVLAGQIVAFFGMVFAIIWSGYVNRFPTIFDGIVMLISFVAPPISAVFLWGVFSKKASGPAALCTLWVGFIIGGLAFLMYNPFDWELGGAVAWFGGLGIHWLMASFYMFVICSVVLLVGSHFWPHRHTAESLKLVWDRPGDCLKGEAWRGIGNFRTLSVVLFVVMVCLYAVLSLPGRARPFLATEVAAVIHAGRPDQSASSWVPDRAAFYAEDGAQTDWRMPVTAWTERTGVIDAAALAGRNLLVLLLDEQSRAWEPDEVAAIHSFVSEQGGGLVVVWAGAPGASAVQANALLQAWDIALTDTEALRPFTLVPVPMFADVRARSRPSGLAPDEVPVASAVALHLRDPADWFLLASESTAGGAPVLATRRVGRGRVTVSGAHLLDPDGIAVDDATGAPNARAVQAALVQTLFRHAAAGRDGLDTREEQEP